jgi:serine phosphatase RsbU (regulator of sigma subunit)
MNTRREQFGGSRLAEVLVGSARGERAVAVRDAIVEAVTTHCAGSPRHDDTTLIVVHRP